MVSDSDTNEDEIIFVDSVEDLVLPAPEMLGEEVNRLVIQAFWSIFRSSK